MPDTPIDQSEGIQSVRLKVPTAEVPIPPEGFVQLHSPAPGELALRLPDGSVVAIGGGGGGGGSVISGDGGVVFTEAGHFWGGAGVAIKPNEGLAILLDGPVVDANLQPQPPDAVTLVAGGAPGLPSGGNYVFYCDPDGVLRRLSQTGEAGLEIGGDDGAKLSLPPGGGASLVGGGDAAVAVGSSAVTLISAGALVQAVAGGIRLTLLSGTAQVSVLPTVDPGVDGALWIAPITRQLMVSAG